MRHCLSPPTGLVTMCGKVWRNLLKPPDRRNGELRVAPTSFLVRTSLKTETAVPGMKSSLSQSQMMSRSMSPLLSHVDLSWIFRLEPMVAALMPGFNKCSGIDMDEKDMWLCS